MVWPGTTIGVPAEVTGTPGEVRGCCGWKLGGTGCIAISTVCRTSEYEQRTEDSALDTALGYPGMLAPVHVCAETMQVLTWDWEPAVVPHVKLHGDIGPAWHEYVSQAGSCGQVCVVGAQLGQLLSATGVLVPIVSVTAKHWTLVDTLVAPHPSLQDFCGHWAAGWTSQTLSTQRAIAQGCEAGAQLGPQAPGACTLEAGCRAPFTVVYWKHVRCRIIVPV